MAQLLRQSTIVDVRLGPFVDVGDGFTPETGVTLGAADEAEILKVDGAATVPMGGTLTAISGCDGWYDYTFASGETDTVGDFTLVMQDDDVYLPVFARFQVVEEEVYDDIFAASAVGYLKPTTAGRDLDVAVTGEAGLDLDNTVGTIDAAQIGADAITAAKVADATIDAATFAAGAIDATAIATDAIDADALATDAAEEIADTVWDELLTGATHNIATSAGQRLRQLADGQIIRDNSFQAGSTTSSLVLDSGASAVDDFFNHTIIKIVNGAAAGQERIISDYVGSTRTATITPALVTAAPAVSDDFEIISGGVVHAETLGGGYENGQVWVDTGNGVAGTQLYVNGTIDNPVDSIADAITIANGLMLVQFHFLPGSAITLGADMSNFELMGKGYTLDLSGENINGTFISGASSIIGIGVSSTTPCLIVDSAIGNVTLDQCTLERCGLTGTITSGTAGDYFLEQCFSEVAGTGTPAFDFGVALLTTNLNLRHYSGGIEIQNMGQAVTDNMSLEGHGQLVINANCAGGTVAIRGHFTITDNAAGAVTLSDDARITRSEIWTEPTRDITGGTIDTVAAGGIGSGAIAAAELNNISDAGLDRRLDLGTDSGGDTTTSRTVRQAFRTLRNRVAIAGGTMTVYEEDDTTADFTAAVTTTAGDPITELNPS